MSRRVGLTLREEFGFPKKKSSEGARSGGEGYGVTYSYGLFGRGKPKVVKPHGKGKER